MKFPFVVATASFLFFLTASALAPRRGQAATLLGDPTLPELADPYLTFFRDTVILSGTAQYALQFRTLADLFNAGPFVVVWNSFFLPDGTPMATDRSSAHSWDMKPVLWSRERGTRLWDSKRDRLPPRVVWYGGRMRSDGSIGARAPEWPRDNFSRDVFAFTEREPGRWISAAESIFHRRVDWPRPKGNYLGHRYGHQIIQLGNGPRGEADDNRPAIFFEEVTEVRPDGLPTITKIFMDRMETPYSAAGKPVELMSPLNPRTGKPWPSTVREDGSALVEGPLYFRFRHGGKNWEAIGFSAGSYYSNYTMNFAARKMADGKKGRPFRPDLTDAGDDLQDAGAGLRALLGIYGGPGRPSVIVDSEGSAVTDSEGNLKVLFHGYRRNSPNPTRSVFLGSLRVRQRRDGSLRFTLLPPRKGSPGPQVRSLPAFHNGHALPIQPKLRGALIPLAHSERAGGAPAPADAG